VAGGAVWRLAILAAEGIERLAREVDLDIITVSV
jgi:hypothetical protein